MPFDLDRLVRPNIRKLKPYSSARSEFAGAADVYLDANENPFGSPAGNGFNRYPDPQQRDLKNKVAAIKNVAPGQIFIGNGSDEAIDLLFRIFCTPGVDEAVICPPTYGMYRVSADVNDVAVTEVQLSGDFQLDVEAITSAVSETTKLIFICSPNNPTGNLMERSSIIEIAKGFNGIVIVDEAYIDYAAEASLLSERDENPNLVILQTFSKAWGMAGLRVGLAFASPEIVDLINRVKPPYNVSGIAQQAMAKAMLASAEVDRWISDTLRQRAWLSAELQQLPLVEKVFPSNANFLLVKVSDPKQIYEDLAARGIVVRDRSNVKGCEGCLRITIGTKTENEKLIRILREFSK